MNIDGKKLKVLQPNFASYSEAMSSNLKTYLGVDEQNNIYALRNGKKIHVLYHYCGPDYHKPAPPKGKPYTCGSFIGDGKLFKLTISQNNKYFINPSFGDVYFWDLNKLTLIKHYIKNSGKIVAVFSPNDKVVLSADENSRGYLYRTKTNTGKEFYWFPNKITGVLKTYRHDSWEDGLTGVVSIKYIDDLHVLVFYVGYPNPFNYAMLYSTKDLAKKYYHTPIKYLPLIPKGSKMVPITNSYVRDQTIDTSPSAHILVMAQAENNGILVYKYEPKTQTLKRIWAPVIH